MGWLLTFGAVIVALVFFRARSVSDGLEILAGMAGMNGWLPLEAQVLQGLETNPLAIMLDMHPFTPFAWIALLLAGVLLLPNAFELLRHLEPAADFPDARDSHVVAHGGRPAWALRSGTQRLIAMFVAILGVMGVLAIADSDAFLYGQF